MGQSLPSEANNRSSRILNAAIVWDNHSCMPVDGSTRLLPKLERFHAAGFTVVSINIGFADMSLNDHIRVVEAIRNWIADRPGTYRLVHSIDDVYLCKSDGKLGIVFDVEGMVPVQDDLTAVKRLYDLGVRWMLVAYNRNNGAGGGCLDIDPGLTQIGREIIAEMERVGMLLCLSHTGRRTSIEAMECATKPVIYSHSNPAAHMPHRRNVADDLIVKCAQSGGVFGLSGIGPFLGDNVDPASKLLDQLRHVIDLVGPAHVGLGLDYIFDKPTLQYNMRSFPERYPSDIPIDFGMVEIEQIAFLVEGLARDNLSDADIENILGGNWARVATAVWQ